MGVLRYNLFWQSIPFLNLSFINEAYWGQDWGSKMMEDWEDTMKTMGYSYVMLSTQENENAKCFYEKLGMYKPDDVVALNKIEWTDFTVE